MGSFGILEGNINGREKKEPTDYASSLDSQQRGNPPALRLVSTSIEQELNREAWAACIGWGPGLNALRTI